jgi:hypothetical protein
MKSLRALIALVGFLATLVFCGSGQAKPSCASALLEDWRDGRIDATYPVGCYRTALAQLPEDLRIYSSAESDIERALRTRSEASLAAKPQRASESGGGNGGVSPLVMLVMVAAIFAAMGSALVLRR